MENRTAYNDGLTIPELCKRILGYELQTWYDKDVQKQDKNGQDLTRMVSIT